MVWTFFYVKWLFSDNFKTLIENYKVKFDFENIFWRKKLCFYIFTFFLYFSFGFHHFFCVEPLWHTFSCFVIFAKWTLFRNFDHLIFTFFLLYLDFPTFFFQMFLLKITIWHLNQLCQNKKLSIWQSKHFGWKKGNIMGFHGKT